MNEYNGKHLYTLEMLYVAAQGKRKKKHFKSITLSLHCETKLFLNTKRTCYLHPDMAQTTTL